MESSFKYSLEGEETERLVFRKLKESDFDTWLQFCTNEDSIKYMTSLQGIQDPIERCKIWFERVLKRYEKGLGGMNVLVHKATHEFVGQCGLLIHDIDGKEELEIGYSLMPHQQGKGYAIEAARKCKHFAFEHQLSDSLISLIHVNNNASAKVAIKNGMEIDRLIQYNNSPVNIFRIKQKI